jgi:hypothetical protein
MFSLDDSFIWFCHCYKPQSDVSQSSASQLESDIESPEYGAMWKSFQA